MITIADEFTSELHLTLSDDAVNLHLVDVDGNEVHLTLSREEMRHLLAAGESTLPRRVGTPDKGAQALAWSHGGIPAYRLAFWDDGMASGGAYTFYPHAADIDALNI